MVGRETIERICHDVSRLPDPDLEREFDHFFETQETICDFLVDSLSDVSQRARELALYLAYVAYKGMSIDSGLSAPIDAGMVLRAGDSARRWLEDIDTYDLAPPDKATDRPPRDSPLGSEPYLLGFVAAEISEASTGETPLDDDEKGALMFTLKTIVQSMALGSNPGPSRPAPRAPEATHPQDEG